MAARNIDRKKLDPERSRIYWDKAQDFFRLMRDAAGSGNWNGAGLAAVHCAVSASDALLVAKAGLRSASKVHEDAAYLIAQHIRHPGAREQAKRLAAILAQKNLIEYVDQSYPEKEALALQKQVERYMAWVQTLLSA